MRGKVHLTAYFFIIWGITPACAGKSCRRCPQRSRSRDHPRVCGEKFRAYAKIWNEWGSPPRMRGKGLMDAELSNAVGITPACAGKSAAQSLDRLCAGDHPRVCGEKAVAHIWWYSWIGSPPRMRGKDGVNDSAQAVTGITPACAGKSSQYGLRGWFFQDHPRVCGEKITLHIRAKVALGSPPRMRGKAFSVLRRQFRFRITPAYAGKRFRWRATRQCEQDHPRVCGEKVLAAYHPAGIPGSPPHMRGKVEKHGWGSSKSGITPAYAGKSCSSSVSSSQRMSWTIRSRI